MDTRRAKTLDQLHSLLRATDRLQSPGADRVRNDLAAAAFHLARDDTATPVVAVIGGTGTGKSTLVNRLLGVDVTATSFRRTFTAGPVAVARAELPATFAHLPHVVATTLPAKGELDRLTFVRHDTDLILIDTPDIDGELIEHHALADRIFRWCDTVIFLVTPEKYQMTELQPYYRLAQRYELPVIFAMNKADDAAVVADYAALLIRSGVRQAVVRAIPRDDATWQPPVDEQLDVSLLSALHTTHRPAGVAARINDAASRLNDQLLQPLWETRRAVDRAIAAVRSIGGDALDVDVHPLTQQLQRRMRERSVLYLIGPQRMIDRVRSVPTTLVRLPRSMWEWTRTGDFKLAMNDVTGRSEAPDFRDVLIEQFQTLQSRVADIIQQSSSITNSGKWKTDPAAAGRIADEEIATLKSWLETRWNATPRDTAVLNKLLKVIPGGKKLSAYSEAAPYLLAIACVTKGAVFGHVDLLILGGYSAVTWLTEKLSDEVASKTRGTNRAIAERYHALAAAQIDGAMKWLDAQAPSAVDLETVSLSLERLRAMNV